MKNITLSIDERLIQQAREKASRQKTTVNSLFRRWLARYVGRDHADSEYRTLMKRLSYAQAGRRFTRDELNER